MYVDTRIYGERLYTMSDLAKLQEEKMCDICQLVSDDMDGGVFITSQPTCQKGREIAIAHRIKITSLLPLLNFPVLEEEDGYGGN